MTRSPKQRDVLAQALKKAQEVTPWRTDATKRKGKAPDGPVVIPAHVKVQRKKRPLGKYEVPKSHRGEFSRGKLGDTL